MNVDDPDLQDEQFIAWLVACDEALAAGTPCPNLGDAATPPELRPRLQRGVACLQLLDQLWPSPGSETPLPSLEFFPNFGLPSSLLGTRLGRFHICRELGRGGFGIVFLANDPLVGREVALKVPRAEALASADQRRRFQLEAQAAGRLDHPNVVPLYEAGEAGSVCYIASAFCPGITLAAWLQEHAEPVPWSVTATLIATLADAVQHAHSRGVLHRDLKPANILLELPIADCRLPIERQEASTLKSAIGNLQSAIPKITDFGLAKCLEKETPNSSVLPAYPALTHSGAIVGTASYMAPEQAEGKIQEISTAADVYALGAILYELLTRRPPFQGETVLATLEQVRTQEPVPPRRIQALVPRDLETICLKCLHKDPSRRYPSGAALADDLRRFLAGEPILARPTGIWERSVKWARRRPALAALAGMVGLAVLGLVLGSVWHNAQLRDALDTAEDRAQEAQRQRQRAEANFRRAEDREQETQRQRKRAEANFRKAANAIHQMLTRVSEARLPNVPGSEHLRRALLLDALRLNQELLQEKSDEPPLRRETGRVFRQLADVYHNLGQQAQAEKAYGQSLALYEGLVAEFPDHSEYQEELAETRNNLAILLVDTGRPDRARRAYEQALTLRKALTDRFPNEPKHRQQQAILQCNLGQLLYRTGHLDEAERIYRGAADVQQNLASRFSSEPVYRYGWSWAVMNRGVVLATTGRAAEAMRCYQQALPLLEKLARDFPRVTGYRYELAGLHNNLALLFLHNRCVAESEAPCRAALALQGKLMADFPRVLDYQRALAGSYQNLTGILMERKRLPEAEKAALQALALRQRLAAQFPQVPDYESDLGATLGVLGSIAQAQGKLADARERLAQAVTHHWKAVKRNPRHLTYRQFLHNDSQDLAEVLLKQGEHAEAARTAVALPQILPGKWQDHRRAVSFLAGCILLAENDQRLAPATRQALARSYGEQALDQLRAAVARGFTDTGDLKHDITLTPLRSLEGFQKLVGGLETKAPSSKP